MAQWQSDNITRAEADEYRRETESSMAAAAYTCLAAVVAGVGLVVLAIRLWGG